MLGSMERPPRIAFGANNGICIDFASKFNPKNLIDLIEPKQVVLMVGMFCCCCCCDFGVKQQINGKSFGYLPPSTLDLTFHGNSPDNKR